MLQRIQTIWLFVVGIAAFLTLKLPIFGGAKDASNIYTELNALNAGVPILVATIAIGVIAFIAIVLYKNRPTQIKLCLAGIVLELILLFLYYQKITAFVDGRLTWLAALHFVIIISFLLAARGINNDEKLIKNTDRLR